MTVVLPLPVIDKDSHHTMDLSCSRKETECTIDLLPPSLTEGSPNNTHLSELAHRPSKPRQSINLIAYSDQCQYRPRRHISDLIRDMSPTSLVAHLLLHQTGLGRPHRPTQIIE